MEVKFRIAGEQVTYTEWMAFRLWKIRKHLKLNNLV